MHSLEYFMAAVKCRLFCFLKLSPWTQTYSDEKNEKIKEQIRKKITEYLDRAEKLKQISQQPKKKAAIASTNGGK